MGKGSRRRPSCVPKIDVDANYERVFGKKRLNVWENPPPKDDSPLNGKITQEQLDEQSKTNTE